MLPDRYVSPELLRINPKCHWPENLEAPSGVQELRCWTSGVLNIMHPHRNEIALDAKIEMVHDSMQVPDTLLGISEWLMGAYALRSQDFTCHYGNCDRIISNIGPPINKLETIDVYVIGLAKHGPAELSNFGSPNIGPPRVHFP